MNETLQSLRTREEIEDWLVGRVATWMTLDPHDVDPGRPFIEYGLASVAAVSISGELEEWLGRRVAPTALWDHPTIERLASVLAPR